MADLNRMTPRELKNAVQKGFPLFVATGSTEYHGSQLPLGTDSMITEGIIRKIEEREEIVVAPTFHFCPTGNMVSGAETGTVDVKIGTFIAYCADVLLSYQKMGFRKIYVLVHHQGGNIAAFLECALKQVNQYSLYERYGDGWWTDRKQIDKESQIEIVPAVFGDDEIRSAFGGHGGVGETQAILALFPQTVKMEDFSENEPWWNETALCADRANAEESMERLIELWLKKIRETP